MNIDIVDFEKMNGLIPAVVQDTKSKSVLMVGFMSRGALEQTIKTKKVTFFSRTKNRLWQKGEESGNILEYVSSELDCDKDTILIQANSSGPTCHTGEYSCFASQVDITDSLGELSRLIEERKALMPTDSYTIEFFTKGLEKIIAKVEEESAEVVQAARIETKQRLAEESGDLIYHLLVLLAEKDVAFDKVLDALKQRNKRKEQL